MQQISSTLARIPASLGLIAVLALSWTSAQPPEGVGRRKIFTSSVIPLPVKGPAPFGLLVNSPVRDHSKDQMDVLFSLSIPKEAQAKLEEKAMKGEVVNPKDLVSTYVPKPEDVARLIAFLKKEGFELTYTSPDKTSVYVRGTVAQIEKTLQVKMVRVTMNGLTYNAAQNAPSLPVEVGASVQAVIGLQPFRRATKKSRVYRDIFPMVAPAIGNAPPYLVQEVLKAYNADQMQVTGKGQRIAILIDTFPLDDDTKYFWQKNNLPIVQNRIEKVNVKNVPLPALEGEESLDVQWASGIASGATIRVYASGSLAFVDLDLALDRIIADAINDTSLRQVSISLGLGEQFLSPDGTLGGEIAVEHLKFLRLAALGVNVFVSSGDAGSNPDQTGHGTGPSQQAEWMASSPFVVGVGGTVLHLAGAGAVASETGWPGSGGGMSKVFSRPTYQNVNGLPAGQKRLVPDISLLAAPETGAYVRLNGQDTQIGGTSLSAPAWAGFCALLNEARTKANKPTLPFLNPLIYPLIGTNCFRDIQGGSNGGFTAGPGYDMVTGIGVPHIKNLSVELTK